VVTEQELLEAFYEDIYHKDPFFACWSPYQMSGDIWVLPVFYNLDDGNLHGFVYGLQRDYDSVKNIKEDLISGPDHEEIYKAVNRVFPSHDRYSDPWSTIGQHDHRYYKHMRERFPDLIPDVGEVR
jgi:hypothetical protein